ncbi:MAG: transcription factor S [Methanomassiliicoccales archaeon]
MFCPKCKSLMFPRQVEGKRVLSCSKCEEKLDCDDSNKECITFTKTNKEMAVIEGNIATLPKTKVECPKCGHNEAFWVLRQTRAADEPETKIYRCVKCQHSWREY